MTVKPQINAKEIKPMKKNYTVARTFWHLGSRIDPAAQGEDAVTIDLTDTGARYYLLDGAITMPSEPVSVPVKAPSKSG